MTTTQEFSFNKQQLRVVDPQNNNQIWFVAKDVCDILEIVDTSNAVQKLDDDEKLIRKIYVSGQERDTWTVNESGLYAIIFKSKKPEAKAFKKWVTSEVLPSIRLTGGYQNHAFVQRETRLQELVTYIDKVERDITDCKNRLTELNKISKVKHDELRIMLKENVNQLSLFIQ